MKTPIQEVIGKRFNGLTVLRLTAGTVASSQAATFVDARCECGRVRPRTRLKSIVDGSVKACQACGEANRRKMQSARRRSQGSLGYVTPKNYETFLKLFSGREREEYDRLMRRHGRCEECAGGVCASDAVTVVMADRGKPKRDAGTDHLHESRDYKWQFEG